MSFLLILFLIILGLGIFFFILLVYDSYKLRKLRKNYNPDDDKSRKGGEFTNFREIKEAEFNTAGLSISQGRSILSSTTSSNNGETGNSVRKSPKISEFFSKLRRKE